MNCRLGTKEDIPFLRTAIRDSWKAHADAEPGYFDREKLLSDDLSEYFADCFNDSGKAYILIAEVEGEVAGFAKMNVEKMRKLLSEDVALFIDDLYTVPRFREGGVGKLLLNEAGKLAKEKGIKWLKGRVYTWNTPAQKTVASAGFKNMYSEWFKILE